tara:strand:- start:843 stop:1058 length:216 start_codon:yes stop_codon:yes gene_type:complete
LHIIVLIGVSLIVLHLFVRERQAVVNRQTGPIGKKLSVLRRWSPYLFALTLLPLLTAALYVIGSVLFEFFF